MLFIILLQCFVFVFNGHIPKGFFFKMLFYIKKNTSKFSLQTTSAVHGDVGAEICVFLPGSLSGQVCLNLFTLILYIRYKIIIVHLSKTKLRI